MAEAKEMIVCLVADDVMHGGAGDDGCVAELEMTPWLEAKEMIVCLARVMM